MNWIKKSISICSLIFFYSFFIWQTSPTALAAAPVVSGVTVDAITHSTARITWNTNIAATGQILFGPTTSYSYQTYKETSFLTNRQWFLSGLAANTTYNFCIQAQDSVGNISSCDGTSNNYTFTTAPLNSSAIPDPVAPTLIDTSMPSQTGTIRNIDASCSNLQTQINSASLGDTIIIPAGTVCTGNYIFPNKTTGSGWIVVRTSTPDSQLPAPGNRISPAHAPLLATLRTNVTGPSYQSRPAVAFDDGAHHYRFIGIEITQAPTALNGENDPASVYSLVSLYWPSIHDIVFDRVYVHGLDYPNRVLNAFYPFNGSRVSIIDSNISKINCWQNYNSVPSSGCGWEGSSAIHLDKGPGPVKISNNRIEAIGIAFFANDDIQSALPTDFEITNNYFYNDEKYREGSPTSDGRHYFNRQQLEFKKGLRILIQGNVFENNWGDINMGYAIELVNHGTGNSQVADVNINNNIIKNSASGMTFNCHEVPGMTVNTKPITRVKITNNILSGLNGYKKIAVPGHFSNGVNATAFNLYGGCEDFQIIHNTVYKNKGIAPAFLFTGYQWNSGLVMKDNVLWYNNDNNLGGIVAEGLGGQIPSVPSRRGKAVLDKHYLALPNTSWTFERNVIVAGFGDSRSDIYPVDFSTITPDYPTGNYWVSSESLINFAEASSGNFTILNPTYKAIASDGTDPGVNMVTLNSVAGNTVSGGGSTNPPSPTVDNTPPSTPSSLMATSITSSSTTITWLASTDNVGVAGYKVFRDGSQIVSTTNITYTDSNLVPNTTYNYSVSAFDTSLNESSRSDQLSVNTSSVYTPPSIFSVGSRIRTTDTLNVRVKASSGKGIKILCVQPSNTTGTLIKGPVSAGGYKWWNIDYDTGCDGWSVEKYLALETAISKTKIINTLTVGSSGSEVSYLQQILRKLGFFNGEVTGYFGSITKQAVIDFQAANNIASVGIVGPKTRELIKELIKQLGL